ncbi:MAG: dephospho-CoA kinase [Oscillospiraceae bacterium]|nr:dephospho-CoA kinase [Oscillospiraceae bacterium]
MSCNMIVGITGISGAGKTTACNMFSAYPDFQVVNCDELALETLAPGTKCFSEIVEYFGDSVVKNGKLNRVEIGRLIFGDADLKRGYEKIIFPYIIYKLIKITACRAAQTKKNVLLDAPTLFESGVHDLCDIIISVVSDEQLALERIMKRDNISQVEAKKRLSTQKSKDFFREHSSFVIENNSEPESFKSEVRKLIAKII